MKGFGLLQSKDIQRFSQIFEGFKEVPRFSKGIKKVCKKFLEYPGIHIQFPTVYKDLLIFSDVSRGHQRVSRDFQNSFSGKSKGC